jgi:aryl-alcohol dehydrogenase-like predicted oxidoreductase
VGIRDQLRVETLGFGAAPLGNMFRNIPEQEAAATVDATWQEGTRYFDTAPRYGAGLSKILPGKALTKHKRDEYVTRLGGVLARERPPTASPSNRRMPEPNTGDRSSHGSRRRISDRKNAARFPHVC